MPDFAGDAPDALNLLLVVFELADLAPGREDREDYARLVEVLETHPAHARLTHDAWIVRARGNAADVLEALDPHLAETDRVFVAELTGEAAWRNAACGFEWLTEHLGAAPHRGFSALP